MPLITIIPPWIKVERALTIDEIPLDWCFSDGVVLDFRHKADGERITVQDVQKELKRIKYEIKPMDIVLIQTGADAAWGTEQYLVKGAGMDRDSTLFLTEKGVKVVGIDAWSWDRPLPFQAKEFKQNGDPKVIWEAHFAGIDIGYCHMEKMANLAAIGKPSGFTVCCFPVKIKGPVPGGRGRWRSSKNRKSLLASPQTAATQLCFNIVGVCPRGFGGLFNLYGIEKGGIK